MQTGGALSDADSDATETGGRGTLPFAIPKGETVLSFVTQYKDLSLETFVDRVREDYLLVSRRPLAITRSVLLRVARAVVLEPGIDAKVLAVRSPTPIPPDRVVIGRVAEADLSIPHSSVSRAHAVLWAVGSARYIADLGSSNRLLVGGEFVRPFVPVELPRGPTPIDLGADVRILLLRPTDLERLVRKLASATDVQSAESPPPSPRPPGETAPQPVPTVRRPDSDRTRKRAHYLVETTLFGEPIELKKHRPTRIGRSDVNEIVLPLMQVSRRHATVAWDRDAFVITDESSINKTLVNGQRMTGPHRLSDGDKIVIGPFTLVYSSSAQGLQRLEGMDADSTVWFGWAEVAGDLAHIPLAEVLRVLVDRHANGRLVIALDGGPTGTIEVRDGVAEQFELVARGQRTIGAAAQAPLLAAEAGTFRFEAAPSDDQPATGRFPPAGGRS